MRYCSKCGKQISDNAVFCKHCGKKVGEVVDEDSKESDQFNCEYCGKEFSSEIMCLKHEKKCESRESTPEPVVERRYESSNVQTKSNAWVWIIIIIIIVIAAFVLLNAYNEGQVAVAEAEHFKFSRLFE